MGPKILPEDVPLIPVVLAALATDFVTTDPAGAGVVTVVAGPVIRLTVGDEVEPLSITVFGTRDARATRLLLGRGLADATAGVLLDGVLPLIIWLVGGAAVLADSGGAASVVTPPAVGGGLSWTDAGSAEGGAAT